MTAEELAREITDPPARYAGELDEAARMVVASGSDPATCSSRSAPATSRSRPDGAGDSGAAMKAELLEKLRSLAEVRLEEPLSRHVTFGVGGPADVYLIAETEDQLREAYALARAAGESRCSSSAPARTCSSATAACAA